MSDMSIRNNISYNPGISAPREPQRKWTTDSVNLNAQTKEEFVRTCNEEPLNSVPSKIANESSSQPVKMTASQFSNAETALVTDKNSTLASEYSSLPYADEKADSSPTTLMTDENGEITGASKALGSNPPDDMLSLSDHKTARVGTFNIEWLGGCPYKDNRRPKPERTEKDYQRVADVIKDSGAALLGLQEVVTEEALFKVLNKLPDWGFILSKNNNQKVAFIFDKTRVKYDANSIEQLNEMSDVKTFNYGNLRPPLSVYMKVDNFDGNFVVVHQKSGFSPDAKKIRQKQSDMMNQWIDSYLQKNSDQDLIIMGDFNDFVDSRPLDSIRGDIMKFSTEEFKNGEYTNIPHKGVIDHIGYTTTKGGAEEEVIPGSVRTIDEKKYPGYTRGISDHKPVTIDLETGIDRD